MVIRLRRFCASMHVLLSLKSFVLSTDPKYTKQTDSRWNESLESTIWIDALWESKFTKTTNYEVIVQHRRDQATDLPEVVAVEREILEPVLEDVANVAEGTLSHRQHVRHHPVHCKQCHWTNEITRPDLVLILEAQFTESLWPTTWGIKLRSNWDQILIYYFHVYLPKM